VHALANVSAVVGAPCAARYGGSADEWKCIFGQYRLPLLAAPHFAIGQQFDSFQLGQNGAGAVCSVLFGSRCGVLLCPVRFLM